MVAMTYEEFLQNKSQSDLYSGFDPLYIPDFLFDFQKDLVDWAIRKGKAALFEDCGLGKTPQQLVWAENIVRKTNKPVLILAPIAVGQQTVKEATKFDIECTRSLDGKHGKNITVANYERLHYFDPNDFSGVVCDESSAIKNFTGERQKAVTSFMRKMPYRLLCTATAAPNDFIELGTSSEALGQLGRMDMLSQFFVNDENSLHPVFWGARWRIKGHAEKMFWKWVCSWARALRKPSDLGYSDENFVLPPLEVLQSVVTNPEPLPGELFNITARTLDEQRAERKATLKIRCEKVAELVSKHDVSVSWCQMNEEGNLLLDMIPHSEQISGADSDESKEEKFEAFASGQIKKLITKPKIGGFGLNWQHCNHTTFFPSHSFEQYYQALRRFWRFGQKHTVYADVVTSDGEANVLLNLQRKAEQADNLFTQLVAEMYNEIKISRKTSNHTTKTIVPEWL